MCNRRSRSPAPRENSLTAFACTSRSPRATLKQRIKCEVRISRVPHSRGRIAEAEVSKDHTPAQLCLVSTFSAVALALAPNEQIKESTGRSVGRINFGEYKESRPLRLANITARAARTNARRRRARRVSLSGYNERPSLVAYCTGRFQDKKFLRSICTCATHHTRARTHRPGRRRGEKRRGDARPDGKHRLTKRHLRVMSQWTLNIKLTMCDLRHDAQVRAVYAAKKRS